MAPILGLSKRIQALRERKLGTMYWTISKTLIGRLKGIFVRLSIRAKKMPKAMAKVLMPRA